MRKWKMFARVPRGQYAENYVPELSFYRNGFAGLGRTNEHIIRVEIRELPRRKKRK